MGAALVTTASAAGGKTAETGDTVVVKDAGVSESVAVASEGLANVEVSGLGGRFSTCTTDPFSEGPLKARIIHINTNIVIQAKLTRRG